MRHVWTCRCCGKQFDTLPLDFSCDAPYHWLQIPESERAQRGKCDADLCMIDRTDFFVRGCLEIPIIGRDDCFVWGIWVSVSEANFERILDLWTAPDVESEPPMFGWLCSQIPHYPRTLELATHVHLRAGGKRPAIELEPTEHPLAVEQRDGISITRVEEIAAQLMLRH